MERFKVTLKGNTFGVEVPETIVVEAQDEKEAEEEARKKSVLENPKVENIEELDFLKK